jgi:hypothetical protein
MALVAAVLISIALGARVSAAESSNMKIRMKVNQTDVVIALADNATARGLVSLLPLRVTLEDYGDVEKIAYLKAKLPTDGAPTASTPSAGDVSYYAPWGNLAFFRKGFRHSTGLIPLGRIESGLEALNATGRVEVLLERLGG